MDNTAQNNNTPFTYPDFSSSTPTPVQTPVVNNPPVQPDMEESLKKDIEFLKNNNTSQPVFESKAYVAQPTELPGLQRKDESIDEISDLLPQEAAPLPPSAMTIDSIGRVKGSLEEIMPEFKKPKAMERDPKANNLAKPVVPEFKEKESLVKRVVNRQIDENIQMNPTPSTPSTPAMIETDSYNIDELLGYAISNNASDLHLSVGYPPVVRIDGELVDIGEKLINPQDAERLIFSILSDEKKELLEVNREIDFAYTYQGAMNARFRVNAYYTMKNLAAAFRLIPSRIRTIEELMLPQIYHQFAKLKQGLVLVTGPTGHGKSTTLASILEDVNRTRFCHIVTIEDPIEYLFEGKKSLIDQREMNDDTHSWEIALRSALRQDPDVILVGEMRDYETISSAITLAETGHLVFATLHTNSASQTIDRIIDVFPENQQQQVRTQIANILEAVVAQRLVPLDKGGRRAVSEIMLSNSAVSNLIREGKTHQIDNVIRTSSDIGMVSLEKALVNLVREGVISIQKAQEYSVYPEEVLRLLKS